MSHYNAKYVTSKYLHKNEIFLGFSEINVYENSLNFEVYIYIYTYVCLICPLLYLLFYY